MDATHPIGGVTRAQPVEPSRTSDDGMPTLYQEIADSARMATGARYVHFSWFDSLTRAVRVSTMSSGEPEFLRRGLEVVRRVFPWWDPTQVSFPADVNPNTAAVFLESRSVHVPLDQIVRGTVHPMIADVASSVVGMRWCFSCPVLVEGRVVGSLALHGPRPFTEAQTSSCEAFARIGALALEHARLLEVVRGHVTELKRTQRLIASAEDRQRKEIAEALHGRLQTRLLVVASRLEGAGERWPEAPDDLLALIDLARAEIERIREDEVRRVSHALHPSIIDVGLVPALRSLVADVPLSASVDADQSVLDLDDPADNRIPPATRLAAYRVAEEAIANVVRHAQGSSVRIALTMDADDRVTLEVRDDGRGFEPARRADGLGFRVIASRVEHLGGEWRVASAPGQGTRLSASFPLAPNPLG